MGTADGPPLPQHTAGSFPTLLVERWRLRCVVNNRRGKPDNHSILTTDAWRRVAQGLFRNYEELTERDAYLIEQYPNPSHFHGDVQMKNQPAPLLPGGITYVTGFQRAGKPAFRPAYAVPVPSGLVVEVDRAYYRLGQRNKIMAWFKAAGLNLRRSTVPKEEFEKRFAEYFGSEPATVSKISQPMIADYVENYFDNTKHPTMDDCESKWPHGSSARDRVRQQYRAEAENRNIPIKRGPRQNSAK